MSLAKTGGKNHMFGQIRSEEFKLKLSQANGTKIYLYSLDKNLIQILPSAKKAAIFFKSTNAIIMKYAYSGKRKCFLNIFKEFFSLKKNLNFFYYFSLNSPPLKVNFYHDFKYYIFINV
jgi:hypothetical protein